MEDSRYKGTPCCVAQERIRALHRELLLQSCGVFESQRVCEFLVLGLASKNNRTRIEAIEVKSCNHSICVHHLSLPVHSANVPTDERASCCATVHEFRAAETQVFIESCRDLAGDRST